MAKKRICKGCSRIVDGDCPRCNRSGKRESARKRGYSYQWEQYSISYRDRWPLCCHCEREGKTTAISKGDGFGQVDHIVRPHGNNDLFWNPENHQGLCRIHHSKKTQLEDSGDYTAEMVRADQEFRKKQLHEFGV